MDRGFSSRFAAKLEELRSASLLRLERPIVSPQGPTIRLADGREAINLCANNYLGLAADPALVAAAHSALDGHGYGMASVRFICGTQDVHRELETRLSDFLRTEDSILFSSCFDANGGLFEPLLDEADAVISDALNHASIIDGLRLCKARKLRYRNVDMADLERCLADSRDARTRLIITDGVFSMDGTIAPLREICDLAERYDALVAVDDSHATGFVGDGGRGTPEYWGVESRVDILTGTLGKALGGASGGYVAGRRPVIEWLRQRSRPYLFSNTIPPVIAATALRALEIVGSGDGEARRRQMRANAAAFREHLSAHGLRVLPGEHPIIPVMFGEAEIAVKMAERLLAQGVYVTAFCYPVVPQGQARIRTQVAATHTPGQLAHAAAAFRTAADELGLR